MPDRRLPEERPEDDRSNGWEAVAHQLITSRDPTIGVRVLQDWMRHLPPGGSVIDVGCGTGVPVSELLLKAGFVVSAIDPSPTLVAAVRDRFPDVEVACEPAEHSSFFGKQFHAAVAIGVLFLLPEDVQKLVIRKIGAALYPGGRFLFTAPAQRCNWPDLSTHRESLSLGAAGYAAALSQAGMKLLADATDEGENYYYDAVKE
jgi:SAM-dependent methyltransferase